jgi:hypothetical protein
MQAQKKEKHAEETGTCRKHMELNFHFWIPVFFIDDRLIESVSLVGCISLGARLA